MGLLLKILFVLLPPVFFLRSESPLLLLLGLFLSTLLAWGMLRLRNKTWNDVGFRKPENIGRLVLVTLVATTVLIPLSFVAKHVVMIITETAPNLDVFKVIQGNIPALMAGLVTAWIFGAFLEEFLFRGFLQNSLAELLSIKGCPRWIAWTGAVLVTSVLTGIGHYYQGITGMVVAGFIAMGFSVIYLMNRRNLWSCILSHGLYDTGAFLLVYGGVHLDQILFRS